MSEFGTNPTTRDFAERLLAFELGEQCHPGTGASHTVQGGGGGRVPGPYSAASFGLHVPPDTVTVTLTDGKKVTGDLSA